MVFAAKGDPMQVDSRKTIGRRFVAPALVTVLAGCGAYDLSGTRLAPSTATGTSIAEGVVVLFALVVAGAVVFFATFDGPFGS